MVSKAKLYAQLASLEKELSDKLIPHLKQAATGDNDLVFCVKQFNLFKDLKNDTNKISEYLIDVSAQILVLNKKLGVSSENSQAEKICSYCREWSYTDQKDRNKAAQELAKKFLNEIDEKYEFKTLN